MRPAPLPSLALLGGLGGNQGGDPASLPHLGLVLQSSATTNQGGDAAFLPHIGLLLGSGQSVAQIEVPATGGLVKRRKKRDEYAFLDGARQVEKVDEQKQPIKRRAAKPEKAPAAALLPTSVKKDHVELLKQSLQGTFKPEQETKQPAADLAAIVATEVRKALRDVIAELRAQQREEAETKRATSEQEAHATRAEQEAQKAIQRAMQSDDEVIAAAIQQREQAKAVLFDAYSQIRALLNSTYSRASGGK